MSSQNISTFTSLNQQSQQVMETGSKSFALASSFFAPKEREACYSLYHWCRYCDDQIDQAEQLSDAQNSLLQLQKEVENCYLGELSPVPAFRAFHQVSLTFQIPDQYPKDLLAGFSMDANGISMETEADLDLYCYRVAGVVGLMMCQIMGVNREEARGQAVDLGIAMQMTNIARDVFEDYQMDRIYLPQTWLREMKIESNQLFLEPAALFLVVRKLLKQAELKYASGLLGLNALPLRAALAVSIASSVYRGIGRKILKQGSSSLFHRTYLSTFEKLCCAVEGIFRILPIAMNRLVHPWKPVQLENPWKFKN